MADVTGLLPSRRRVEALARALEGEPAPADVMALARLAATLENLPSPAVAEPEPGFRERLRERLVTEAQETPVPREDAHPRRSGAGTGGSVHPLHRVAVRKRAVAVAAAAGLGLGVGGAGVASADALPGEALYGMKRATESLRLAVAGSDADRGRLLLSFADRRTGELESLLGTTRGLGGPADVPMSASGADPEALRETLADWDQSTRDGASLLLSAHEATGDVGTLTDLDAFTREQRQRLTTLAPSLPPDLRDEARDALTLLDSLQQRTVRLLEEAQGGARSDPAAPCAGPSCPAVPPPTPTSSAPSPSRTGSGGDATSGGDARDGDTSTGSGSGSSGDADGDVGGVDLPTSTPSPGAGLEDTVDDLGDTLGDTTDGAGDTLNDTTDGVGDTLNDTTDGVGDTLNKTTDGVGGTLDGTTDGLTGD